MTTNRQQESSEIAHYHCRGCGRPLEPSSKALFHPDCLLVDKRRRTREQRQAEREKYQKWVTQQCCHRCGAKQGHPSGSKAQGKWGTPP